MFCKLFLFKHMDTFILRTAYNQFLQKTVLIYILHYIFASSLELFRHMRICCDWVEMIVEVLGTDPNFIPGTETCLGVHFTEPFMCISSRRRKNIDKYLYDSSINIINFDKFYFLQISNHHMLMKNVLQLWYKPRICRINAYHLSYQ